MTQEQHQTYGTSLRTMFEAAGFDPIASGRGIGAKAEDVRHMTLNSCFSDTYQAYLKHVVGTAALSQALQVCKDHKADVKKKTAIFTDQSLA